ncbi:HAD family hydrolase [Streptomyces sp. NPDC001070]
MSSSPTAVLFDLDGVLLDSRRAMRQAVLGVAGAVLGKPFGESELPADLDHLRHDELLAHLGVADQEIAFGTAWEIALGVAMRNASPFPGAVDVLRDLATAGTEIGLVTMQPRTRVAWMIPQEISSYFSVVVGWGDAEPKPSGAGILLALDRLGVPPGRACFVGDSPSDIAAASAAGIPSIGAAWGYTGVALERCDPTVLVHALSHVPEAAKRLLGLA